MNHILHGCSGGGGGGGVEAFQWRKKMIYYRGRQPELECARTIYTRTWNLRT